MKDLWKQFCRCTHLLVPARFTIAVNLTLFLLLEFVDQAQDVLAAMLNRDAAGLRFFLIALFLLATQSWYWLRFIYDNFARDPLPSSQRHTIVRQATGHTPAYVEWLPRLIGLLPFLAAFFALWKAGGSYRRPVLLPLALIAGEAALFIALTWARRKWIRGRQRSAAARKARPPTLLREPDQNGDLARAGRILAIVALITIVVAIVFSWGSLGWAPWNYSPWPARLLGLMVAATAFITAGTLRVPVGTRLWLAFLLLMASSCVLAAAEWPRVFAEIGSGATLILAAAAWIGIVNLVLIFPAETLGLPVAGAAALLLITGVAAPYALNKEDLGSHVVRLADHPPADRPTLRSAFDRWVDQKKNVIVLIAAQGGASRAGYWTAAALGALEDSIKDFHRSVFAMSGVSGGSLGLAVYQTQLRHGKECKEHDSYKDCAIAFFSQDFLAPDFARLFNVDLLQDMLPGSLLPDRAAALEQSWEQRWRELYEDGVSLSDPIDGWRNAQKGDEWYPVLLLNGTSVSSGKRIVTSDVDLGDAFTDAPDFFCVSPFSVSLSTAAHNSARFPYISPAGTLLDMDRRPVDRIVDGGYFEGLGAQALLDLIPKIAEWRSKTPAILVLTLEDFTDDWTSEISGMDKPLPDSMKVMSEAFSPIIGLYSTHSAHSEWSVRKLKEMNDRGEITLVRLMFRSDEKSLQPAMSWVLSDESMTQLDLAWNRLSKEVGTVHDTVCATSSPSDQSCTLQALSDSR